ncbi:hypothetical protein MZO42_17230 [Sphingomonas psychrotolerans]|uniref:DUF2147 domain-containing protein n=1 Tax=Sphingomonas psychrotolerans TaxID=1327635 RepID=A0ABU3N7Z6_9SPHN|nr:hypothetical protein [Sphingomonas psychrotolerans]MDT8760446.1 hypothetical protein [Sphingomonas psychrotolerans]
MRILSCVLALAGVAGSAAASEGTLPARFQGEWAVRLADCGSKGGDNTEGMTIGARDIGHYEESITVKRVTLLGRDSVRYEGTLSTYDGDEPAAGTLRLSADGSRLIEAGYADGPNSKAPDLLRCPK